MAIVAQCDCGHRFRLAEALAGRTIPCPKCGGAVLVPQPSAMAVATRAAKRQAAVNAPPVSINPMLIIAATVVLILVVIVSAMYFGPWTVGKQWEAMSSRANSDVTDVVQFAIQAYESQHGMYDAAASHMAPQVQGEAAFVPPYMAFSMPRHIMFTGKTNQGNYIGTYDTSNGEISADIETGGFTIGGLVDAKPATGRFHITGREKDNQVTAECDGVPLKIVMRKLPGKTG